MRVLEKTYPLEQWASGMTPFEILISTVLSQSTTIANERRGMEGLRAGLGEITPVEVAAASEGDIVRAIWHAGLARQKAPRIRAIAQHVASAWHGDLETVFRLPTEEARRALMSLPGVGPKTADVVLAMAGRHAIFPVDTHIARIARRWKLAQRFDYEAIRKAFERWTPPNKRIAWHLSIIAHGRILCKAQRPRCDLCPVSRDCDWYQTRNGRVRNKG